MLKTVIDTNVLLVSISQKSPYHWIFQKLVDEFFELYLTNAIVYEYESIILKHTNEMYVSQFMEFLDSAVNVVWIKDYYKWQLIEVDPDDNKFVDCAIAGGADFIVTEDKHFNVLKEIPFPKVNVINIQEFKDCLNIRF